MPTAAKKILVVDDDPVAVRLVQSVLTSNGYSVSTAGDGLEALVRVKKDKPDLVILDVMMPEINGYDVCYQLRFNEEYEHIPIILLTARDKELNEDIGQRINIEYMSKPADTKVLLAKVEDLIGKSQP